jgi:peptidoglycan hydrolase CwlO-like protein
MKEFIDSLSGRIDGLAHEVAELHETLQGLQKTTDNLSSGLKDVKEVKQGQANMLTLLKEMASTINSLKEKKTWFKF